MRSRLSALTAALLFVVASHSASAAAGDDRAAALLAKHRAFVGWQLGDGSITSLRIESEITDDKGKKIESDLNLWKGIVFNDAATDLEAGGVTEHFGFTGNIFWHSDISNFTIPVYGGLAKYQASLTVLRNEGTTELPATYQRDATVDGKKVGVVRVTLQNADPIDLYVDPDTGAYVQATIDPDGAYETTYHILKYAQALPGKRIVSSYRIDDGQDATTYTKIEANVPISSQQLHPPEQTASWTFTDQNPAPIVLTHNRILIDATVDGVPGRFILDTGADGIYLNERFADRIKAPALEGHGTAQTVYSEVPIRVRKIDSLTVGGATLHSFLAVSRNFEDGNWRGLDAKGYDGLIGFDFFAGAIVKLDIYASKITVLDPSTDISTAPGVPMTVDISSGQPAVPMTLNKSIEVRALLDTGTPGLILFGPNLVKKHHLNFIGPCMTVGSLALGPIDYEGESACEWYLAGDDMLLGYDFLKHFDIVFDYPHGRMILNPNKN